jgi:hypothetical protein
VKEKGIAAAGQQWGGRLSRENHLLVQATSNRKIVFYKIFISIILDNI